MDAKLIGEAIVGALVIIKSIADYFGARNSRLEQEQRFALLTGAIAEVRAFCVGPDGTNGIRGDLREMKKRVNGLEQRELERLTEGR